MSDHIQQPPSISALWAILWRAVVWFPIAIGIMIAAPAIPLLLTAWGAAYVIIQDWWKAGACVLGLVVYALAWRWVKRFVPARYEAENLSRRGGWLF